MKKGWALHPHVLAVRSASILRLGARVALASTVEEKPKWVLGVDLGAFLGFCLICLGILEDLFEHFGGPLKEFEHWAISTGY